LRDSLDLSNIQFKEIYRINQDLQKEKDSVWKKFNNPEFIRSGLQSVENKRDSLYRTVFTNQQSCLYNKNKNYLISNK
jgi:hypothetical protein